MKAILKNNRIYFVHDSTSDDESIGDFQRIIKKIFEKKRLSDLYRVVYGGNYTILLDNYTGDRLDKVTREKTVKPNLYKAVLYLLLRFRGVYGTEIERYLKNTPWTYLGLMEYLLEFGFKNNYTHTEVLKLHELIEVEQDPEVGFLYVLAYDRFGYTKDEIDELVKNAICSEKASTKRRKCTKSYKEKLKEHPIKRPKRAAIKNREDLETL